jgi:hypothetical protein
MGIEDGHMVFSGPATGRGQLSRLLLAQGFELAPGDPRHGQGLPDTTEGGEDKDIAWLTVLGNEVDGAVGLVEPLGWHLRSHAPAVQRIAGIAPDDIGERLKRAEADIEAVKALINAGGE